MERRCSLMRRPCSGRSNRRCAPSHGEWSRLRSHSSHRSFYDAVCCMVSMNASDALKAKPLLRGWSHALAAIVSVAGLVALIVVTRDDPAKLVSMIVYGTGLVLLFGVSATYHIFKWPPRVKDWLRRVDHATIFVF